MRSALSTVTAAVPSVLANSAGGELIISPCKLRIKPCSSMALKTG